MQNRTWIALLGTAALAADLVGCRSPSSQPVASGTDTVDASLPTQLPRTAIPSRYAIEITPHADQLTFDGSVAIDLKVIKLTNQLVLNAADLTIASAALTPKSGAALPAKVSTDGDAQTATFVFAQPLQPGDYRLDIRYSGKINTQANGLFALDYTNVDGKPARSLFTQFEASDARRFVPSWDEPDYKARFDLTARVPDGQMAVGNMPAASTRSIGGSIKEVKFQTSPVMSSYLLFFAVGDFDRITKSAAGREVGVVMSRGNGDKGHAALDAEAQILPYYNEYFGIPYPLPKLDNVAGPGQSQFFSAMENWGAIFTFENSLLLDPSITSEAGKQTIFNTEAHEMAHMWFGDLVTMAWWDDLWLNEGFASWMARKTTQHFHPDWGADLDQVGARETAMNLDSFRTTHPVVQTIRTVEQANQAFDSITYSKGESVISMLEGFAGADVWRRGIQHYIHRHSYHNTRTNDLWTAIEGAGAHGLTSIANDFTTQPGIPLITVAPARCVAGKTVTMLIQTEFSNDRRQQASARGLIWRVPVRASTGGAVTQVITQGRSTPLSVAGCGPLLINAGQTGYFRTLYAAPLAQSLQGAFPRLGAVDQYGTMQDALALALAGYQPMGWALNMMAAVPSNANAKVVQVAALDWSGLYDDLDGDSVSRSAIAQRMARVFGSRLQAIGLTPRQGEAQIDAVLRPTLISQLGKIGDRGVIAEANRLFASWLKNRNAIPGALKSTWLSVAAQNATPATWEALHAAARDTQGQIERSTLYQLLGSSRDEGLAQRALDLALTAEPGKTISAGIINAVAQQHPALALKFVLSHVAQVNQLIDLSGRSRFVAGLVSTSNDPAMIAKLQAYGNATFRATDRKPIEQAIARIDWRATNRDRIRAETVQWLKAHPQG